MACKIFIFIHIHTITCIHSLTLYPCIWRWTLTLTLTLALVTPNPHPRIWLSCRRWRMVEPFLAWSASARCPWMWFVRILFILVTLYIMYTVFALCVECKHINWDRLWTAVSANGCVSVFACMVVCRCLVLVKDNKAEAGRNCQLLLFFLSFRG